MTCDAAGCSNKLQVKSHRFPAKLEIDVCFMFFKCIWDNSFENRKTIWQSSISAHSALLLVPSLQYSNQYLVTKNQYLKKIRISQISIGYYDAVSTFYQYTCTYSIPWFSHSLTTKCESMRHGGDPNVCPVEDKSQRMRQPAVSGWPSW